MLSVVDAYTRECFGFGSGNEFRPPDSDAGIGCDRGRARAAHGDPLRQRAGTDQSAFSGVVCGATDRVDPHSARKAYAERTGRELSRKVVRRVFDGELVSEFIRCPAQDRGLAQGVQRGASAQQLGISDTARVCCCNESG